MNREFKFFLGVLLGVFLISFVFTSNQVSLLMELVFPSENYDLPGSNNRSISTGRMIGEINNEPQAVFFGIALIAITIFAMVSVFRRLRKE